VEGHLELSLKSEGSCERRIKVKHTTLKKGRSWSRYDLPYEGQEE